MSLSEAPAEIELKICNIVSGVEAKRKLGSLGLRVDDMLIKKNDSRWGPILVQNLSTGALKVALGRGLADKIIVEEYGD
jgi:Fe2+ transport system protein FeoA